MYGGLNIDVENESDSISQALTHMLAGSVVPPPLLQQHLLSPLHTPAMQLLLSLLWLLDCKKNLSSVSLLALQVNLGLSHFPCGCAPLSLHSHRLSLMLKERQPEAIG